ncbi:hypothetical protein ACAW74_27840 [Fibrella sp. WM1]|uniref:hypothetical protein n=1 Tax=Fibrella musci TaxID=3242485 RepID=UPI00351FC3F2
MRYILLTISLLVVFVDAAPLFGQSATPPTATSSPAPRRPSPLRAIGHTFYSEKSELFAEFRPLLVGQPNRFTAHLTRLGTLFTPYTEGEATLTLETAGKLNYREIIQKPAAPGIFRFAVKPETTGLSKITISFVTSVGTEQFVIDGVMVYDTESAAVASQPKPEPETGDVAYYKEKSWLVPFATAPVALGKLAGANVLLVPQKALIRANGGVYVYRQQDPEHFRKQAVTIGRTDAENAEVLSGLRAGDRIVTVGADQIN